MENQRQESFGKLRPPCVELSSVALRLRAGQSQPSDVQRALNAVYEVLRSLGSKDALDEKLAEYVFFPLSQVFNEAKRLPLRCVEIAIKSTEILVEKGWRQRLSPEMGKQLLILLSLLIGNNPIQNQGGAALSAELEELTCAIFKCMAALFRVLEGPTAKQTIFHEIGTATIIDQTAYMLLEGVSEGTSNDIGRAAMEALQMLFNRITDRVVLASIMPRTVSALVKVLKPSTQVRRSFRLLEGALKLLTRILRSVLNDNVAFEWQSKADRLESPDRLVLDESWLKATAGQIKIALSNVVQVRRHDRQQVRDALLDLCVMVIQDCHKSLSDSQTLMVETIVVLSEVDERNVGNNAYSSLQHLATVYPHVLDILKDLLHTWTMSFRRTMQGNDEVLKQRAIRQISTTFQVLSQLHASSDILESNMASSLSDSVMAVVQSTKGIPQQLSSTPGSGLEVAVLEKQESLQSFPPVLLHHSSQQQTLADLQSMILKLNHTDSADAITRFIMNRVHQSSGESLIAPFWLSLRFLTLTNRPDIDEFLQVDGSTPLLSRATMVEELYSVALKILNDSPSSEPHHWQLSALALEAVALQAQQLGEEFRPELIDALYPVLQFLASNNPALQNHAMACLNILTKSCNYPDTRAMLIENVDYLVNAIGLKLHALDASPYPPQVLLMMVKLSGAGLIPYLDDVVDSIFGIIDMYHGYPKLVELLFSTLSAIVNEGVKEPSLLAITQDGEQDRPEDRDIQPLSITALVDEVARRREKRVKSEELDRELESERLSHPARPWTRELDGGPPLEEDEQDQGSIPEREGFADETDEPLPAPKEPQDAEKPLSKPHTLLLHIVKSVPPHLSSPSPFLRRSLLELVSQALPVLARNEKSFLPLINDIWPSVNARIAFPSASSLSTTDRSLTFDKSSSSSSTEIILRLETRPADEEDIREETYVTSAACTAVATMCQYAGEFMSSRVENEYPRWRRLYQRCWEQVRADADKTLARRAATTTTAKHPQQHPSSEPQSQQSETTALTPAKPFFLDMSLTTRTTASTPARSFTPHHTIWRSLISLFISMLAHTRLPLAIGDEICEFIATWVVRFVGGDYYRRYRHLRRSSRGGTSKAMTAITPLAGGSSSSKGESILQAVEEEVDHAIRTMETWNADLTWFLFRERQGEEEMQEEIQDGRIKTRTGLGERLARFNERVLQREGLDGRNRFADVIF
ncbi:hypothetical protein VTN31DRAFT_300 [Thermomyces dupontii]|uniref:uncharacterized protein n=1 Tax=Talaromyces thermophilus TaxID=28565 RepID=UPI003743DE88